MACALLNGHVASPGCSLSHAFAHFHACSQVLTDRDRVLGKDHPNTLTSLNNLAALLKSKGKPADAEPLYRRALEGRQKLLGDEHPNTLSSLNNLAHLLRDQGKNKEAEEGFKKVRRRGLVGRTLPG